MNVLLASLSLLSGPLLQADIAEFDRILKDLDTQLDVANAPPTISLNEALDKEEKKYAEEDKKKVKGAKEKLQKVWQSMREDRKKVVEKPIRVLDSVRAKAETLCGNNPSRIQSLGALALKMDKDGPVDRFTKARTELQKAAETARDRLAFWVKDLVESEYKTQYAIGGKGYSQAVYERAYSQASAGARKVVADLAVKLAGMRGAAEVLIDHHKSVAEKKGKDCEEVETNLREAIRDYESFAAAQAKSPQDPDADRALKSDLKKYGELMADLAGTVKKMKFTMISSEVIAGLKSARTLNNMVQDRIKDEKVRDLESKHDTIVQFLELLDAQAEARSREIMRRDQWEKVVNQKDPEESVD